MSLACAAVLLAAAPARAADPTLQLSVNTDYTTGKYGDTRPTDVVYIPFSAKVIDGDWTFRATVPFADVKGPAGVIALTDEAGEANNNPAEELAEDAARSRARFGLSDVSFSVSHAFNRIGGSPLYLDTTARVRLPTGDWRNGLGVGATDVFLDAELGADWKKGGAYVDVGRRFLGNAPDFGRRDGWRASVGDWWNVTRKLQIGASYDWQAASVEGLPAYQLVGGYVSYRLDRHLRVQLYSGAGLSRSSPDADVSLGLFYRFGGRRR
jgi:hypothetical protein